ncbi:MAG: pirin family protein [Panacibacter sp.]
MIKEVEGVFKSSAFHMVGDGFRVANYFPNGNKFGRKISPFILLDYHPSFYYSPTTNKRGVGVHPHRGFETVTLALEGYVAHHDSGGNSGIIGPGDVQWMTAASGVLHKEYHEENFAAKGGNMQMLQLWVNLPKAVKMTAPKYQTITSAQIPVVKLPENAGTVHVIAGSYLNVQGPAATFTPINMYRVQLNKNGKVTFNLPVLHNTGFLITSGELQVNGSEIAREGEFVLFNHKGNEITVIAKEDTQFIVLDGEPIDEPIVQYGPFVMNKPEEINQAIEDFNNGKFGVLEGN